MSVGASLVACVGISLQVLLELEIQYELSVGLGLEI